MIERVVLIRLEAKWREQRDEVARAMREVLVQAPEVLALRVGVPADARSEREWDLCIEVGFSDLDAVERYRASEVHRKVVDVFLRPMLERIRVYNFAVSDAFDRDA